MAKNKTTLPQVQIILDKYNMTYKQYLYASYILEGFKKGEAYIKAFKPKPNITSKDVSARAWRLSNLECVKNYIHDIKLQANEEAKRQQAVKDKIVEESVKQEVTHSKILTINERMELLTRIAMNEESNYKVIAGRHVADIPIAMRDRLSALKILNEFDVSKNEGTSITDVNINITDTSNTTRVTVSTNNEKLDNEVTEEDDIDDVMGDDE